VIPLGPLLQTFFVHHLASHKRASLQTIAAYRDCFRLLLGFLHRRRGLEPARLVLTDVGPDTVLSFLDHLEKERANSIRSRNARLAAIRSFFRFVALAAPEAIGQVTRILAIPVKRIDRRLVGYLTRPEVEAILAAPDRTQRTGRRDHALLVTLYNSGARVSEIVALRRGDVEFGATTVLHLRGKGRKERAVPLWPKTSRALRAWFMEIDPAGPAFPNARGHPLSRFGVRYRLTCAVTRAASKCTSLQAKSVTPHVLRHTTAMHLLQSGVDPAVIALWLGHERLETTHVYLEADLASKQRALDKFAPAGPSSGRFNASDSLLAFLQAL
jgi:site-specific recombinase XerD